MAKLFLLVVLASAVSAFRHVGSKGEDKACQAMDLKHRAAFQSKLADMCVEMCKEVGAYPNCAQCAGFVPPDPTPGVMTWEELLEHMDNLVDWGHDQLKSWRKQASALQKKMQMKMQSHATPAFLENDEKACESTDLKYRQMVQSKLSDM